MKQSRLDELMQKCEKNEIQLSEIGEICGSILLSLSKHSNDIKNKLSDLEKKISQFENKIQDMSKYQPFFGVISDLDEDEPDQD